MPKKLKHTAVKPHVPSLPEIDLQEGTAIMLKTPDMLLHISVQEGGLCIQEVDNCSTKFLVEPVASNMVKLWVHKFQVQVQVIPVVAHSDSSLQDINI
jgi:hypothetical protein